MNVRQFYTNFIHGSAVTTYIHILYGLQVTLTV